MYVRQFVIEEVQTLLFNVYPVIQNKHVLYFEYYLQLSILPLAHDWPYVIAGEAPGLAAIGILPSIHLLHCLDDV